MKADRKTVEIVKELVSKYIEDKPRRITLKLDWKDYRSLINALPKNSEYIFNPNIHTTRQNFQKQRNRIARTLQNPRIRQIHLYTFRHWFATMQYYKTRDILYVKHLLGHKQIKNPEVYTHLINFERDDYHVAFAKTLEEEKELIEAGFEFVRYSEKDEVAIYRKRK